VDDGYDLLAEMVTLARAGKPYRHLLERLKKSMTQDPQVRALVVRLINNLVEKGQ
jgi:hypothetical protein